MYLTVIQSTKKFFLYKSVTFVPFVIDFFRVRGKESHQLPPQNNCSVAFLSMKKKQKSGRTFSLKMTRLATQCLLVMKRHSHQELVLDVSRSPEQNLVNRFIITEHSSVLSSAAALTPSFRGGHGTGLGVSGAVKFLDFSTPRLFEAPVKP